MTLYERSGPLRTLTGCPATTTGAGITVHVAVGDGVGVTGGIDTGTTVGVGVSAITLVVAAGAGRMVESGAIVEVLTGVSPVAFDRTGVGDATTATLSLLPPIITGDCRGAVQLSSRRTPGKIRLILVSISLFLSPFVCGVVACNSISFW